MNTLQNDVRRPWAGRACAAPLRAASYFSTAALSLPSGQRAFRAASTAAFFLFLTACGTSRGAGSGYSTHSADSAGRPKVGRVIPPATTAPAPGTLIPAPSHRLRARLLAAGPQRAEKHLSGSGR